MIEFRNVNKKYSTGTEAVHNANFTIEKGEFPLPPWFLVVFVSNFKIALWV